MVIIVVVFVVYYANLQHMESYIQKQNIKPKYEKPQIFYQQLLESSPNVQDNSFASSQPPSSASLLRTVVCAPLNEKRAVNIC